MLEIRFYESNRQRGPQTQKKVSAPLVTLSLEIEMPRQKDFPTKSWIG